MKFNLGNRSLLPEEVGLIDHVNSVLQSSAAKHGYVIKKKLVLHTTHVNGNPVYKCAQEGHDPVEIPLAPS